MEFEAARREALAARREAQAMKTMVRALPPVHERTEHYMGDNTPTANDRSESPDYIRALTTRTLAARQSAMSGGQFGVGTQGDGATCPTGATTTSGPTASGPSGSDTGGPGRPVQTTDGPKLAAMGNPFGGGPDLTQLCATVGCDERGRHKCDVLECANKQYCVRNCIRLCPCGCLRKYCPVHLPTTREEV